MLQFGVVAIVVLPLHPDGLQSPTESVKVKVFSTKEELAVTRKELFFYFMFEQFLISPQNHLPKTVI